MQCRQNKVMHVNVKLHCISTDRKFLLLSLAVFLYNKIQYFRYEHKVCAFRHELSFTSCSSQNSEGLGRRSAGKSLANWTWKRKTAGNVHHEFRVATASVCYSVRHSAHVCLQLCIQNEPEMHPECIKPCSASLDLIKTINKCNLSISSGVSCPRRRTSLNLLNNRPFYHGKKFCFMARKDVSN